MNSEFQAIFTRLRRILQKHAGAFKVKDSATSYLLEGNVGPAALQAWGGKIKRSSMPVAWVQIGKAYVSYHLMGIYGNARLCDAMSKELKARMQGKTCFNFKSHNAALFEELDRLTGQAIAGFRSAGYSSEERPVRSRAASATVPRGICK